MSKVGRNGDPREDLAGAPGARRASASDVADANEEGGVDDDVNAASEPNEPDEEDHEPVGAGGADVAPTKRAEARERERHRIERSIGHTPAGEDGQIRGRNAADVSREQLDDAAREADRRVVGHELPPKKS
jgi:hypothetical protein